jgi:hypothetical protein
LEPSAGDHDPVEDLFTRRVANDPSVVGALQTVDTRAEPDPGSKVEHVGVAVEVGQDLAVRRERVGAVVFEVAEGGHDATCVGVHGRPHATDTV